MSIPTTDRAPADQLVGLTGLNSSGVPTNFVNSDTNGNLLVKDYATSATGSAVPSSAVYLGAKNSSGNLTGLLTDSSANLLVNIQPLSATGSLAALNAAVTFTLSGQANVTFQLAGTFSATITFEGCNDNANWTTVLAYKVGDNTISSTATVADTYRVSVAGLTYVRARVSAYTSGTVVVTGNATAFTSGVILNAPIPAGTNNIGTFTLPTGASTSANQTTEITSLQLIDNPVGSVAAGTAGTSSFLAGVIYNSTLPVATTGQQMGMQSDLAGRVLVNDTANVSSQYKALSVTTTATLAIGGSVVMANRKVIVITPTNGTVYWGTSNAVTTTTGTPLFAYQTLTLNFGPSITIYLIAAATTDVRVMEAS